MAVTLFHDQAQVLHVFFHVNKERNGVRKKGREGGRKEDGKVHRLESRRKIGR